MYAPSDVPRCSVITPRAASTALQT